MQKRWRRQLTGKGEEDTEHTYVQRTCCSSSHSTCDTSSSSSSSSQDPFLLGGGGGAKLAVYCPRFHRGTDSPNSAFLNSLRPASFARNRRIPIQSDRPTNSPPTFSITLAPSLRNFQPPSHPLPKPPLSPPAMVRSSRYITCKPTLPPPFFFLPQSRRGD